MKEFREQILDLLQKAYDRYGYDGIKYETGINRQNFYKWLSGKQDPNLASLIKIANLMGYHLVPMGMNSDNRLQAEKFLVQEDGTISRKVDLSQYEAVPIVKNPDNLSHVRGENFIEDDNILYPAIIHKSSEVLDNSSPNLIGVTVLESSIGTLIEKSDSLFFDREDRVVDEDGHVYLVRTPNGETLIRRVILTTDGDDTRLTFYSENHDVKALSFHLDDYEGDLDRAILGRGVWFRGDLRNL